MYTLIRRRLDFAAAPRRLFVLYSVTYLLAGLAMNTIGKVLRIAEFVTWYQVFTCYVLYLVPASLLVRHRTFFDQYLFGLLTLAPLELGGYALGTSRAFEGNILDRVLGPRNFALAMVVFFGWILPLGNRAVAWLDGRLFAGMEG
jgi:hypothetical protein